ncbi:uncharacterized protein J3R85_000283 [Psidium guajava]|nr:uncharacterized protein J3R85_000283 [Psidium guajava]
MDAKPVDSSSQSPSTSSEDKPTIPSVSRTENPSFELPSFLSASSVSSWTQKLKLPQPVASSQDSSQSPNSGIAKLSRFANGMGFRLPVGTPTTNDAVQGTSENAQSGVFGSVAKGLLDSSRNAVKAVQVKARHVVSQNKRRYQEGGFDLDMTYITENVIAMGFPAGDISSGLFGYLEGFYRNHMEEVINFFETHHQGKYKVYNLCSERLYASLFGGKVATFPFADHNCPPMPLILSFCQSASSWLKEDIENVVAVHCKAGMARTGLMICSLLLFLKIFPAADEAIAYYNQKRCVDGKALVLPSQIRYVHYFERVLTGFSREIPAARRCMLRGFRLHRCPSWIRPAITISDHSGVLFSSKKHPKIKDLTPQDFWIKPPKKGVVVFAIPGEPGLTELKGDFKIHFHEHQGDFYCWLNTTMMENRILLSSSDLDGFDKRNIPSPGLHVEVVMIDYDGTMPAKANSDSTGKEPDTVSRSSDPNGRAATKSNSTKASQKDDNDDDVFSDGEGEETRPSNNKQVRPHYGDELTVVPDTRSSSVKQMETLTQSADKLSLGSEQYSQNYANKEVRSDGAEKAASGLEMPKLDSGGVSDFKAIAADASVFTFGDEEDYESE